MKKVYHILNGDELQAKFPKNILGEQIVIRECLVDGDVSGETSTEFYANRAHFISTAYEEIEESQYFEKVVPELEKIRDIPQSAEVNLWFEDDLFCQVNCWYVLHLLKENGHKGDLYLVRPHTELIEGFGKLDEVDLVSIFKFRKKLSPAEFKKWAAFWELYREDEEDRMLLEAIELESSFPFLLPVVEAHLARKSVGHDPGRPELVLMEIMDELQTHEFEPLFREFSIRESIYGFGDLQVKRILDKLIIKG